VKVTAPNDILSWLMSEQLLMNCFQLVTIFLINLCLKLENKIGKGELIESSINERQAFRFFSRYYQLLL